jgi:hypothetical protein
MLQQMTESEKLGDTYFDVSHLVYDKFQLISQYPLVFFTQVPLLGLKCFMFPRIIDLCCSRWTLLKVTVCQMLQKLCKMKNWVIIFCCQSQICHLNLKLCIKTKKPIFAFAQSMQLVCTEFQLILEYWLLFVSVTVSKGFLFLLINDLHCFWATSSKISFCQTLQWMTEKWK